MHESELGLFAQIHFGDEEFEMLFDVAVQHRRCALGNAIAVLDEPCFEPGALIGREDDDVVFAHRVLRLYGHAERPLSFGTCRSGEFGDHVHGTAFRVH